MNQKLDYKKEEIKGIVCVTHYFKKNKEERLSFISATYVDFLHENGESIKESFIYKIDPKKTLLKSKKEIESFLNKVYSFSEKKESLLVFSHNLPVEYKKDPKTEKNLNIRFITKKEYLKDPKSFSNVDVEVEEEIIPNEVVFLSSYVLESGEVHAIGMNHFNFYDKKTIKEEVLFFDENRTVKQLDKKLELFVKKWTLYAEKRDVLIMEMEPVVSKKKKTLKALRLTEEAYLDQVLSKDVRSDETEVNSQDSELDPAAEGLVTITPYFDDRKELKMVSSVYVNFNNGKGNVISANKTLWIDFNDRNMQNKIDFFMKDEKNFAKSKKAEFILLDSEKMEYCNDPTCNCGEPKLSFLSQSEYLDLFSPTANNFSKNDKKDGQWLN